MISGSLDSSEQLPIVMPKIRRHGTWNLGILGMLGKWNCTRGIFGRPNTISPWPGGPHPGHPTSTGTTVGSDSPGAFVVIQVFVVQREFEASSIESPGGTTSIVDVGSESLCVYDTGRNDASCAELEPPAPVVTIMIIGNG